MTLLQDMVEEGLARQLQVEDIVKLPEMIDEYVSVHMKTSISFTTMGHLNYFSALQFVDGVIGNSSSGLSEVPFLGIGTVNIGDRQKGRISLESVINCKNNKLPITIKGFNETIPINYDQKIP